MALALVEFVAIVATIGALAGAALGAGDPIAVDLAVRVAAANPDRPSIEQRDRAWRGVAYLTAFRF